MPDAAGDFFIHIGSLLDRLASVELKPRHLRPLLASLYLAIADEVALKAPFEGMSETDLHERAVGWADAITDGKAKWQLDKSSTEYLLSLFSLVRALDDLCHAFPRARVNDPSNWFEPQSQSYVVPRYRSRDKFFPRGQGVRRRLLRHHRIVPAKLAGRDVEFVSFAQGSFDDDARPTTLGAAMFKDLELSPPLSGNSFIIEKITGNDLLATIDAQIAAAVEERCLALAWPELSVDVEHRHHIRKRLQDIAGRGSATMPQIVVAGSSHEMFDGKWYNRTMVYDGYGDRSHPYCKISPYYRLEDGCAEGIEPGATIPIFVTDHYVVGVAICRDLVDFNRTEDLEALEIDLLIVPSMGGISTLDSHEAAAMKLKAANDTRVFVVQTNDRVKQTEPSGWVLAAPKKPIGARKNQDSTWVSYASEIR